MTTTVCRNHHFPWICPRGMALFIALAMKAATFFWGGPALCHAENHHILYINSYHAGYRWSDEIQKGLMERFRPSHLKIEVCIESLDTRRFPQEKVTELMADMLEAKYGGHHHDLVIVSDNAALDFAIGNRTRLFPGRPIVFCGYTQFQSDMVEGLSDITGVNAEADLSGLVQTAMDIEPDIRTLVFIVSTAGGICRDIARKAEKEIIPKYGDRHDIVLFKDAPLARIRHAVSRLGRRSALFLVGQTSDPEDPHALPEKDIGRQIAAASPAPVYTLWEIYLGTGVLGGKISTGYDQGRKAADMALQILSGRAAGSIPVLLSSSSRHIFDYTVLKRFGISADDLPKGSRVIRMPHSFYKTHREIIWTVMVVFSGLVAMIVALFLNILRRRRAEALLQEQSDNLERTVQEQTGELVASNKALKESESRFQSLSDASFEGIVLSEKGEAVDSNTALAEMFGYEKEEIAGKRLIDFVAPELRQEVQGKIESGYSKSYKAEGLKKDGTRFPVEIQGKMFRYQGRDVRVTAVRDISEQRKIQQERDRIIDLSLDLICIGNLDGFFLRTNPSFHTTLGYSDKELQTHSFFDWIHPDDLASARAEFGRLKSGHRVHGFECRFKRKDGAYLWLNWTAVSVPEEKRFYAVGRDATDRRKMIEAIKEREERIRSIVETAADGIITIDEKGLIRHFNRASEQIFGYLAEEVIGANVSCLMPEPNQSRHNQFVKSFLESGRENLKSVGREVEGRRKNGSIFPLDLSINAVVLGNRKMFTGILRDITERKRTEKALKQAKEAADLANRAKSDFLASMSHEIRTPMNAIIGMAELLNDTDLTEEQRNYVRIFQGAGENLLSIINDILDISKIEAGQIELESEPFAFREMIESICEIMAIRTHEKGIELNCWLGPKIPDAVYGDPVRLRQILINLLGNAVKFTECGEVMLKVEQIFRPKKSENEDQNKVGEDEPGTVQLRFSVSDTGIGIPADKLETIFERFSQVDASTTRKFGGTGLGLAICRRLVEMMGGRLQVESQEGNGALFHFSLWLKPAPGKMATPPEPMERFKGMRVLVVDDNGTNRLILHQVLSAWEMSVTTVPSGQEALVQMNRSQEDGQPFDIVLLDGRMPEMDGFEVAEQIRNTLDLAATTVMMITSGDRLEDRPRSRHLGINAYLVKPVKKHELQKALQKSISGLFAEKAETTRRVSAPEAMPARGCQILLVDDSPDNRLLARTFLEKAGYRVVEAGNGKEAVDTFAEGVYDLVLMDVQMPVMDGYTATRAIRRWEDESGTGKRTPVIALTAHAFKEQEAESLSAGCDAHMSKPIKKANLLETVAFFVDRSC